jgi:hypothetical protein
VDAVKTIILGKVTFVMLNNHSGIRAKLTLPKFIELAGVAIFLKEKAASLAKRIVSEGTRVDPQMLQFNLIDLKPTVARIFVFGEYSVHRSIRVAGFYKK